MGDLHLVHPVLNLSVLIAGILIMVMTSNCDDVLLDHGGLLHVHPLAEGTTPSCITVVGWVGCGLQHFSGSPRPLGFGVGSKGFRAKGLGPGLDNLLFMLKA